MIRLLLVIGLAVLGYYFVRWLYHQPRGTQWRSMLGLVAIVLLLLVATGRAHWLTAIFAAALAFIRLLLPLLGQIPVLKRILGAAGSAQSSPKPEQDQTSTVQSHYIVMTLNHDSGEINGEVLVGKYKGRMLNQLTLEELLELLQECQSDEESVALLQAFLDREYESEWREHGSQNQEQQSDDTHGRHFAEMSRGEAFKILGLSPDASKEEIIDAHRRLMQTLHPDRGGSSWLAAKINQAKETLLA